jgi:8-oxo-dGTP diphosphatase
MINVVGAVIYDENRGFLCGQRFDFNNKWEFIGGKIEQGESPKQALLREIKEEINCDIEIIKEVHIVQNEKITLYTFLSRIVSGEPELRVHKQLRWVNIEELKFLNMLEADIPTIIKILEWAEKGEI